MNVGVMGPSLGSCKALPVGVVVVAVVAGVEG
jgi:hypothetical protein